MAQFDMITNVSAQVLDQAFVISNRYFHIDTADNQTVRDWLKFNPYIDTFAMYSDQVEGFFNLIPITNDCASMFEDQVLKEEDLSIDHILPHSELKNAEYAYFAAIAVKDTKSYLSRQCVAAMLSVIASQLLHGYRRGTFKRLFANPTTFLGNEMIRRLGLKPLVAHKKPLKANDIYVTDMNPETIAALQGIEARYGRFVGRNPWAAQAL